MDDASFFFSGSSGVDLASHVYATLTRIGASTSNTNLKLNGRKTKVVLVRPHHKVCEVAPIVLNQTPVELVKCFKTSGVYFVETVSWTERIDYSVQKLSCATGLMHCRCYALPTPVNFVLYKCLFGSMLKYGALVLPTATQENIGKLMVVAKMSHLPSQQSSASF